MVGGKERGYGAIFMRIFHGGSEFSMKAAPDFPALF